MASIRIRIRSCNVKEWKMNLNRMFNLSRSSKGTTDKASCVGAPKTMYFGVWNNDIGVKTKTFKPLALRFFSLEKKSTFTSHHYHMLYPVGLSRNKNLPLI